MSGLKALVSCMENELKYMVSEIYPDLKDEEQPFNSLIINEKGIKKAFISFREEFVLSNPKKIYYLLVKLKQKLLSD